MNWLIALFVVVFMTVPALAAESVLPVLAQARHPGGALIQLHSADGPCVNGAKLATYTAPNGQDKVPGCYKANADSGTVAIAWLDGDASTIPMQVFKAPDGV